MIKKQQQYGFSLLEVLISLVIIASGVMGLSGLQITSIKGTIDAHVRNEASLILMDVANRVRSNKNGMQDYFTFTGETKIDCDTGRSVLVCNNTTTCSQTQLAQYNLNQVACRAAKKLPLGTLTITKKANPEADCNLATDNGYPYYDLSIGWVRTVNKKVANSVNSRRNSNLVHKNVSLGCFTPGKN